MHRYDLTRFITAHEKNYATALGEISNGKKMSHWMWFIFPQLKGLGLSDTAKFYGLAGIDEAAEYYNHPILKKHLIEIANAVLQINGKTAHEIFGSPDDLKLRSCTTLFARVGNSDPVFEKVLAKYFRGTADASTLLLLNKNQ